MDWVGPACESGTGDIRTASGPEVVAAQYLFNIYLHTPMDNAG
jgi:hypothetical protein